MRSFLAIATASLLAGFSATVLAQGDVIAERKAVMRANAEAAKAASEMISGAKPYDAAAAEAAMRKIAEDMEKFPTLFPAGSDQGDTRAAAAIWTDTARFNELAAKTVTDANAAADAAAQGVEAFKTAFATVGGNCQACHQSFREQE